LTDRAAQAEAVNKELFERIQQSETERNNLALQIDHFEDENFQLRNNQLDLSRQLEEAQNRIHSLEETESEVETNSDSDEEGMAQAQAETQIPSTILDSLLLPKIFSGKRGEDGMEWWTEFTAFVEFRGLSEAQALKLFQLLQSAYSKAWYAKLQAGDKDTMEHLKAAFKKEFESASVDDWRARADTLKRTQRPGESALEYVHNLVKNAEKHTIDNETAMAVLIQGLQKEVRTFVAQKNPKTLEEALEAIKVADSVLEVSASDDNQGVTARLDKITEQLRALTQTQQGTVAAMQTPQTPKTYTNRTYTPRTDGTRNTRPPYHQYQQVRQPYRQRSPFRGNIGMRSEQSPGRSCGRCGKTHTSVSFSSSMPDATSSQCRALTLRCHKCGSVGHLQSVCRSRYTPRSRSPNPAH